jgi:hypothetical protein
LEETFERRNQISLNVVHIDAFVMDAKLYPGDAAVNSSLSGEGKHAAAKALVLRR